MHFLTGKVFMLQIKFVWECKYKKSLYFPSWFALQNAHNQLMKWCCKIGKYIVSGYGYFFWWLSINYSKIRHMYLLQNMFCKSFFFHVISCNVHRNVWTSVVCFYTCLPTINLHFIMFTNLFLSLFDFKVTFLVSSYYFAKNVHCSFHLYISKHRKH